MSKLYILSREDHDDQSDLMCFVDRKSTIDHELWNLNMSVDA